MSRPWRCPVGGGPTGTCSGTPASGLGGSSPGGAPGKGKQARVILDDDEVSFDEDEPLQKRLRQHFGVGPTVLDEAAVTTAVADKEATDKRAAEEATVKRATEERATKEATAKAAAAEEVADKTVDEPAGAVGGSPTPSQAPSVSREEMAPEVVPEPVPEVVREEALTDGGHDNSPRGGGSSAIP
jgi:hypothetical protein